MTSVKADTHALSVELSLLSSNCRVAISRGSLKAIVAEGDQARRDAVASDEAAAAPPAAKPKPSSSSSSSSGSLLDHAALRGALAPLLEAVAADEPALHRALSAWIIPTPPPLPPPRSPSSAILDEALDLAAAAVVDGDAALLGDALDDLIDEDASLGARSPVAQLAEAAVRLDSAEWILLTVRLLLLPSAGTDRFAPLLASLREKASLATAPSMSAARAALPCFVAIDKAGAAIDAAASTVSFERAALLVLASLGSTAAAYVERQPEHLYGEALDRAVAPAATSPRAVLLAFSIVRTLARAVVAPATAPATTLSVEERVAALFCALSVLLANVTLLQSTHAVRDEPALFIAEATSMLSETCALASTATVHLTLGVSDAAQQVVRDAALCCWSSCLPLAYPTRAARLRFIAERSEHALSTPPSPETRAYFRWASSSRAVRSVLPDYALVAARLSCGAPAADADPDAELLRRAVRALVALASSPTFTTEAAHQRGPIDVLAGLRVALLDAAAAVFSARRNVTPLPFERKRSARHALLSPGRIGAPATVTHGGTSGSWVMAAATEGFRPMTGLHRWRVRVDRCKLCHVFVGLATGKARAEGYLGNDAESWGIIGTREVWHASRKFHTDYGDQFRQGALLELVYDSDRGTLTLQRVCSEVTPDGEESSIGRPMGVVAYAFENMPQHEILYPAVALLNRDDCVSVYLPAPAMTQLALGGWEQRAKVSCAAEFGAALVDQCAAAGHFDEAGHLSRDVVKPILAAMCLWSSFGCVAGAAAAVASPLKRFIAAQMDAERAGEEDDTMMTTTMTTRPPLSFNRSVNMVDGDWVVHSGAAGNIASQIYDVSFALTKLGALSGSGGSKKSKCEVKGHVGGTRVRFVETWGKSAGECFVVARLAIDGCSFAGIYQDHSTGAVGTLFAALKPSAAKRARRMQGRVTEMVSILTLASMLVGKAVANDVVSQRITDPADPQLAKWCRSALFARGLVDDAAAAVPAAVPAVIATATAMAVDGTEENDDDFSALDEHMRKNHAKSSRFTANLCESMNAARLAALKVLLALVGATGPTEKMSASLSSHDSATASSSSSLPLSLSPDGRLVAVWKAVEKLMRKMRVLRARGGSSGPGSGKKRSATIVAAELQQRVQFLSRVPPAVGGVDELLLEALHFLCDDLRPIAVHELGQRLLIASSAASAQMEALQTFASVLICVGSERDARCCSAAPLLLQWIPVALCATRRNFPRVPLGSQIMMEPSMSGLSLLLRTPLRLPALFTRAQSIVAFPTEGAFATLVPCGCSRADRDRIARQLYEITTLVCTQLADTEEFDGESVDWLMDSLLAGVSALATLVFALPDRGDASVSAEVRELVTMARTDTLNIVASLLLALKSRSEGLNGAAFGCGGFTSDDSAAVLTAAMLRLAMLVVTSDEELRYLAVDLLIGAVWREGCTPLRAAFDAPILACVADMLESLAVPPNSMWGTALAVLSVETSSEFKTPHLVAIARSHALRALLSLIDQLGPGDVGGSGSALVVQHKARVEASLHTLEQCTIAVAA